MFMLEPIERIRSDLKKKIDEAESKIKTMEQNKIYLQKNVKDHENSIREMLSTRRYIMIINTQKYVYKFVYLFLLE